MAKRRQFRAWISAAASTAATLVLCGAAAGAEHATAPSAPSSRFTRPVAPNEARLLKAEEDTALAVADSAAHDMEVLAHTVPEHRLARSELASLHAIRPLVQRRQQLRQTFIRLGAKPVTVAVATSSKPATGKGLGSSGPIGSAAGGDGQAALLAATHQMQETQMSFNLQYLQLQGAMTRTPGAAGAISDIVKTKHETVKNSIGNIR
ncbi:MAG: hypothetical protein JSR45_13295 [Proteobacteria bacterium]|nr:hypothetical protein [Pseudomonadota bacterium]